MDLKIPVKLHNTFEIFKETAEGRQKIGHAENVVLDAFYSRFFFAHNQDALDNIWLGTGVGEPNPTRTNLFNRVFNKSYSSHSVVYDLPTSSRTLEFTLGVAEGNGYNFTEIGLGYQSSTLYTHAMIKDSEGNPITISKTDTEILYISATIYFTVPEELPRGMYYKRPLEYNSILRRGLGNGHWHQDYSGGSGYYNRVKVFNDNKIIVNTDAKTISGDIEDNLYGVSAVTATSITRSAKFSTTSILVDASSVLFLHAILIDLTEVDGFTGTGKAGVVLGTGTGRRKAFFLPNGDIKEGSLNVFVDGVLQNPSLYTTDLKGRTPLQSAVQETISGAGKLGLPNGYSTKFMDLHIEMSSVKKSDGSTDSAKTRVIAKRRVGRSEEFELVSDNVYDIPSNVSFSPMDVPGVYTNKRGTIFYLDPGTGAIAGTYTMGADLEAKLGANGINGFINNTYFQHIINDWYFVYNATNGIYSPATFINIDHERRTYGDIVTMNTHLTGTAHSNLGTPIGIMDGSDKMAFVYSNAVIRFYDVDIETMTIGSTRLTNHSYTSGLTMLPVLDKQTKRIKYFLSLVNPGSTSNVTYQQIKWVDDALSVVNVGTRSDNGQVVGPATASVSNSNYFSRNCDLRTYVIENGYGEGIDLIYSYGNEVAGSSYYYAVAIIALDKVANSVSQVLTPTRVVQTFGGLQHSASLTGLGTAHIGVFYEGGNVGTYSYHYQGEFKLDWMPGITFNEAVPNGAVVTADFVTPYLDKHALNVVDVSLTISK